jgi:hypothetical protein
MPTRECRSIEPSSRAGREVDVTATQEAYARNTSGVRPSALAILGVLVLASLNACGEGDDSDKSTEAPASAGERAAVAELKYCVEGAGAKTAKPGESIPGLGKAPSGPDVPDATRALVIYWTDTKDLAHVYYAADEKVAKAAASRLGSDVKQKGSLVVVPDSANPPMPDDEGLLLDDCLL